MPIKLGSTDITTLKLGSSDVSQAYLGATPLLSTSYNFGNYIQPDGVNDIGTTASSITINWTTDWVVSFWFKGDGNSNATNVLLSSSISTGYYWYIRKGSTPYVRYQSGANNTRQDWSDAALAGWDDGDWHHFYMYNVGTDVHLVFDGIDYGDGGATGSQDGVNIDYVFYRGASNTFYSDLAMDDIIATQTTGSVTQAQSLYNGGAGENPTSVFGATPDYWYKFNVTDGTTTIPNSGSAGSNDLTLSNFVTPFIFLH